LSNIDLVRVKHSYIIIPTSDEDKFGGVGAMTLRPLSERRYAREKRGLKGFIGGIR
jgi:hypothetical protein